VQRCAYHVGCRQVRDITTSRNRSCEHTGEGGPDGQDGYSDELHGESSLLLFVLTMSRVFVELLNGWQAVMEVLKEKSKGRGGGWWIERGRGKEV